MKNENKIKDCKMLGLYIPKGLHASLKKEAIDQQRTLTDLVISVLKKFLEKNEK